jgi:hypothetical protein
VVFSGCAGREMKRKMKRESALSFRHIPPEN